MYFPTRTLALTGLLLTLGLTLSACNRLPAGAPKRDEILKQAGTETGDFAIYPVTRAFLPTVSQWPITGKQRDLSWIGASRGARTQIIQPGDTLTLNIWDSSENSLLTATDERVARLEEVEVSANGAIFVPYIGNISVIGLTPDLAREQLQRSLEVIVPSAQVQLSLAEGRNNSVTLVGGVGAPGSYPMPDRNYTLLGLLADGGGVVNGFTHPQVRLQRGGAIYGTSIDKLYENPGFNTLLRGGDNVIVAEDERYFASFGATGIEALHTFTDDTLSAMDALSIVGGVSDNKADPQGLLILREYPSSAIRPGERGPRNTRVVFTIDLKSADGLFSARKFKINPNDLVMATESPVNEVVFVSNIVGNFVGLFNATQNLAN
jgi:polysaccharide biosynthesis/export protein